MKPLTSEVSAGWEHLACDHLLQLPRLHEMMRKIVQEPVFHLDFNKHKLASKVLADCYDAWCTTVVFACAVVGSV